MAMCDSSWFKKRTPLKVFGFTLQWRAASKEVPWSSKGVQQLVFYLLAETSMWSLRLQKVPRFWELPSFSSSGRSWNLNWEAVLLGFSLPAPASKSALKVFGFTLQWRAASKEVPWSSKGVQQLVFYLLAATSMWSLRLQKVPRFWELPSFSSSGRSWNLLQASWFRIVWSAGTVKHYQTLIFHGPPRVGIFFQFLAGGKRSQKDTDLEYNSHYSGIFWWSLRIIHSLPALWKLI